MITFVDDNLDRFDQMDANNPGIHARVFDNVDQAINDLNDASPFPEILSLDHDLIGEATIRPLIFYIRDNPQCFKNTLIVIHSTNSIGVAWCYETLKHLDLHLMVMPYAWSFKNFYNNLFKWYQIYDT